MFVFSQRSLEELEGVHPDLVKVTTHALGISNVDFAVHDGVRTRETQAQYVSTGVSRTMRSKHLIQTDGYGHAVDLVPFVAGKLRWEWPPIYDVARAMRQAAQGEGVKIRWGGIWRRLDKCEESPESAVRAYCDQRRSQGKPAFIDGPHFEIVI